MPITYEDLSHDQISGHDLVMSWLNDPAFYRRPQFVLTGLAGTGKTTISRVILESCLRSGMHVAVAAPTGKAAQVLNTKIGDLVHASTIHSLLYRPVGEVEDDITGEVELKFKERDHREFKTDLLVIDEASMIGQRMYDQIMSRRIPTLWIGDHGQLAPVKANDPGIMASPDYSLTRIHRQAEGSPIIDLAHRVRETGKIQRIPGIGYCLATTPRAIAQNYITRGLDVLIVNTNSDRMIINRAIRALKGYNSGSPVEGDRVVCLFNNRMKQIFNGELFEIERIHSENDHTMNATLRAEDGRRVRTNMLLEQFEEPKTLSDMGSVNVSLFNYGYALTCHKSQGSQWERVGIFDHNVYRDQKRWYYTAITRASDNLTIFRTAA